MSEEIFRKKSLDRVKSPENLDDYIKVANPGVWLLLISVVILLAGACVWGVFGHIDSTVPTVVSVENGEVSCRIAPEDVSSVRVGLVVRFADTETIITDMDKSGDGTYICSLFAKDAHVDGFYDGVVVIESYRPMSFILN